MSYRRKDAHSEALELTALLSKRYGPERVFLSDESINPSYSNSSDPIALFSEGLTLASGGRNEAAIQKYIEALELRPASKVADIYFNLALARSRIDGASPDAVIEDFTQALRQPRQDDYIYLGSLLDRGEWYQKKGDTDKAVADYLKVLEDSEQDKGDLRLVSAPRRLGDIFLTRSNYDKAIEYYSIAIQRMNEGAHPIDPPDGPASYSGRAAAYDKRGHPGVREKADADRRAAAVVAAP